MIFKEKIPVAKIAEKLGAKLIGDDSLEILGMNEINKIQPGQLIFVDYEKYYEPVLNSDASAILIDKEVECPKGKAILVHEDPFQAFTRLARELNPREVIHQCIDPTSTIGEGTIIEKGAIIASNCTIGRNCHIHAGAYIGKDTIIGNACNVQPGAIIGSDAFYFNKKDGQYIPWRSIGRVIIGDRVYIGSCTTVNRGVTGDTIVGDGTKIDCQVQLGHGVVLGKNCLLAAQVGIGGKTIVGDDVVIYGQVGIAQRLRIGSGAVILAQSGIGKDLESNKTYFGSPASEVKQKFRELAALRNLPDFMKTIKD